MEQIREPIRTAAIFTPGRQIRPVWFDWHSRRYDIRETCYTWQEHSGSTLLLHFSVICDEALYELVYDTRQQRWILDGVEQK